MSDSPGIQLRSIKNEVSVPKNVVRCDREYFLTQPLIIKNNKYVLYSSLSTFGISNLFG